MSRCRICDSPTSPFMSFGQMPIANGFLAEERFSQEYFFELAIAFCAHCGMVQLVEQPVRERMFNEHYAFFSGTSTAMAGHFREFADRVIAGYLPAQDPFVVEIGSNDGIMLQRFSEKRIRHLGIEPSANVAEVAKRRGLNTIAEFFDEKLAARIVQEYGQANAILGANVMCHIPYLHSVIEGMKILLKGDGVVVFEDPYIGDVVENTTYDQFYDEHVFLFSVLSISFLFGRHDMEVVDVEPQWTHGGSMRYVVARKGARPISRSVHEHLERERALGLDRPSVYARFKENCESSRAALTALLKNIKGEGERVVGYAATSKSTTILNYCGIGPDLIEFISDTTPIKQGKFSPGVHIPVRPHEAFLREYPDYALLFAYNHAKEIMAKEAGFVASGGQWIVYVPEVKVL